MSETAPAFKIVVATYGGGHVNLLLPVIKKLLLDPSVDLKILGFTSAGPTLKENNISYLGFKDIATSLGDPVLRKGRELLGDNAGNGILEEESIAYLGVNYLDMVEQLGEKQAQKSYAKNGRQAFYPLPTMQKFLEVERPDLVIATNSPRSEKAIIDAAGVLKIPSLCIVDLFGISEMKWIAKNNFASKLCVLTQSVKQQYIEAGRNSQNIVVTGNPAFDAMKEYKSPAKRAAFRKRFSFKEKDKVVLFASNVEPTNHPFRGDHPFPNIVDDTETALNQIAKNTDNLHFIFRPHPNDPRKPIIKEKNIYLGESNESLYLTLAGVDLVVVLASTVGLQAALLDKPVLCMRQSIFSDDAPYGKMGVAVDVERPEDLEAAILGVEQQKNVDNHLSKNLGKATQNILKVIYELLGAP